MGVSGRNIFVDHKDDNPLNNTRTNLVICTNKENQSKRRKNKKATSRYKGVSFYKAYGKWAAEIMHFNKKTFLGYFTSEIDAALAYDKIAKELFGNFVRLNFPNDTTKETN